MTREQAIDAAREASKAGYVVHVNRSSVTPSRYYLSEWFDSSTVISFENGRVK